MKPATERFSNRVQDYIKYRPGYPTAVLDLLEARCGLRTGSPVADLGAGTGIFSALLLDRGARVFAVEPNADMRAAAEQLLGNREGFTSVAAPAEHSGLPDGAVHLVTAAQAFHWFDRRAARDECRRILTPGGYACILWNERHVGTSPFLQDYEQLLLDFSTDYTRVDHRNVTEADLADFFGGRRPEYASFPNAQSFDYDGLKGRLLSSSYAPAEEQPGHEAMLARLKGIFDRHQEGGHVTMTYDTRVHWGQP